MAPCVTLGARGSAGRSERSSFARKATERAGTPALLHISSGKVDFCDSRIPPSVTRRAAYGFHHFRRRGHTLVDTDAGHFRVASSRWDRRRDGGSVLVVR